jgi:uncharacterized protein YbjT (DUF2867 family)
MESLPAVRLDSGMTNTTATDSLTTLVIGGHGKTGRRVAQRLAALGRDVRVGSRSTVPTFDWNDQATWPAALDGVTAAYVTFQPDLAVPGATDAIAAFGAAARRHGLDRLVLLSGRGEPEAQACEQILLTSGVDTTIVRCSFFAQNFSEHFLRDAVLDGVIAFPAGDVREPIVDADDIADVVAAALTEPFHTGELYELTGPRLLTFADAVGEIAAATGRRITIVPVSIEDYAVRMKAAGVPEDVASLVNYLFGEVLDGRSAHVVNGVERALGRPARDFADYARDAAATGVWEVRS